MAVNVKLLIAYRGTDFHGWQKQAGVRTVQEHLEQVACRVCKHPVHINGSGRTDAGVHAAGQVANFVTDSPIAPENLGRAINGRLDRDVAILHACAVHRDFHASRSAASKLYRYRIYNTTRRPAAEGPFVYHYWPRLDVDRMRQAARRFEGRHDFASFAASGDQRAGTVRTIFCCRVFRCFDEVRVDVHGSGFLYKMVRNMVGTLLEIGRGRWEPERIDRILAARDNREPGPTAPPQGLCLQWVRYPPKLLSPS